MIKRVSLVGHLLIIISELFNIYMNFPAGTVIKNPPVSAGDTGDPGSIPG